LNLPKLKNEFTTAFRGVAENGFGKSAAELSKTVHVSANGHGHFHPGGGSQNPVSSERAAALCDESTTEREMATTGRRPTPFRRLRRAWKATSAMVRCSSRDHELHETRRTPPSCLRPPAREKSG